MIEDSFIIHLINGHKMPAYIDCVGTGAIFGSIVACAVAIPNQFQNYRINDSKLLPHKLIYKLAPELKTKVVYAFGSVSAKELLLTIKNNLKGEHIAMTRAVMALKEKIEIDSVFVDGKYTLPNTNITSYAVIRGDQKVFGIAVASIIAKDVRDHLLMKRYGEKYSAYHIISNKGYRSPKHISALRKFGPVYPLHRTYLPQFKYILCRKENF
jgi:ribonuclease HII